MKDKVYREYFHSCISIYNISISVNFQIVQYISIFVHRNHYISYRQQRVTYNSIINFLLFPFLVNFVVHDFNRANITRSFDTKSTARATLRCIASRRVAQTRRTNLRGNGRGERVNYEECEWLDQARLKRSAPLVASRRR